MKKYYCVTISFDDRCRVTAGITNMVEASAKPESMFTSTSRKDIYNDWFEPKSIRWTQKGEKN